MKTVTVLVGSARKEHTYRAARGFLDRLESHTEIRTEIIPLSRHRIEQCRGCKTCFEKGEEYCPLDDDVPEILQKLRHSDGVVLATPNYAFQVSGTMKTFLDRIAFGLHRPSHFGKTFSCIVAQGIHGGGKIVKYLGFIGRCLGFVRVPGAVIKTLEPLTRKAETANNRALDRLARRFASHLTKSSTPSPSIPDLIVFRLSRSGIRTKLTRENRDYAYYEEQGWFDSDFYYPVRLSLPKRAVGRLVDAIGGRTEQPGDYQQ